MLARARAFFAKRNVIEVDPCAFSPYATIDSNIDVLSSAISIQDIGYLHTSPEYAMKQLLAKGSGDIYFLGHVFRQGEIGRLHAPEFTMVEWYRLNISFDDMMQETVDFISLFLKKRPVRKIRYREAFETYVGIDYKQASLQELLIKVRSLNVSSEASSWPRSTLLHFLLAHAIEPHFGRGELTILYDYPPEEAALARLIQRDGELVAERFEIYYEGVELSNGYHELAQAQELRCRFTAENALRSAAGKPTYALNEEFLAILGPNFPDCCGVSVGFDRVLLLQHKTETLSEVLPFAWLPKLTSRGCL